MKTFSLYLVVVLKIQTIESETVAKALLNAQKNKGFSIYESDEIHKSELIKNTFKRLPGFFCI
jgi:hypothetical protein